MGRRMWPRLRVRVGVRISIRVSVRVRVIIRVRSNECLVHRGGDIVEIVEAVVAAGVVLQREWDIWLGVVHTRPQSP